MGHEEKEKKIREEIQEDEDLKKTACNHTYLAEPVHPVGLA